MIAVVIYSADGAIAASSAISVIKHSCAVTIRLRACVNPGQVLISCTQTCFNKSLRNSLLAALHCCLLHLQAGSALQTYTLGWVGCCQAFPSTCPAAVGAAATCCSSSKRLARYWAVCMGRDRQHSCGEEGWPRAKA